MFPESADLLETSLHPVGTFDVGPEAEAESLHLAFIHNKLTVNQQHLHRKEKKITFTTILETKIVNSKKVGNFSNPSNSEVTF